MGWGKDELARAKEISRERCAADGSCGSGCREMLGLQPWITALGADVDEPKRARGYGGEAERRSQDLPTAFPIRTINDEGVGYLSIPGRTAKQFQSRASRLGCAAHLIECLGEVFVQVRILGQCGQHRILP